MNTPKPGILFNFHDPAIIADPYPTYARMRIGSPLWHNPASNSYTITRYRDVQRVLTGSEFSNRRVDDLFGRLRPEDKEIAEQMRPLLEPRLLFTEGEKHARIKKLLAQCFSPAHLAHYEVMIEERVSLLVARLPKKGTVEMVRELTNPLPGMVILSLLGLPADEQEEMKSWTDQIYAWIGHSEGSIVERTKLAIDSIRGLRHRLLGHIEEVRKSPRQDMLSSLVHAREEGLLLDENELVANVIGLVNAGQETTACLLANGILRLVQHPEQMELLRQRPELITAAIEEMLRYDAPAQFIARHTTEPMEMHGHRLQPGDLVALGLGSANRDEEIFEDPDRFDIQRPHKNHLSFGYAHHSCVGSGLARLESKAFFSALIGRVRSMSQDWDLKEGIKWRSTLSFRCPAALPIAIER
jgi:cytochrome P450